MGVFLSKPCVAKFSEDGEDESIGFGVSSMQGWRKNMEDAHLALLKIRQAGANGVAEDTKIRLFGVFDGHGGKEVALFVQEHLAEELVKLEEFKGGDFQRALVRSFHRMDELLEGAAVELRRTHESEYGYSPGSSMGGRGDGKGFSAAVNGGESLSVERNKAIVEELLAFRSRKNPSDDDSDPFTRPGVEGVIRGNKHHVSSDDSESDDENEARSAGGNRRVNDHPGLIEVGDTDSSGSDNSSGGSNFGAGSGTADGGDNTRNDDSSSSSSSNNHVSNSTRLKMADALELFHRILDLRTKTGTGIRGVAAREAGNDKSEGGHGKGDVGVDGVARGDDTANKASPETGEGNGFGGSSEEGGEGGASESFSREDEDDVGVNDDEGEDTFGDSEPEEDDVVVTDNVNDDVRPRMGIGASLQSLIHPGEGPICTLSDHPIQAGCTSVVCLLVGKTLYVANAGDSRAVLCRGSDAVELSKDHKPMSQEEKRRIERAGGFINAAGRVNGNLNLSRSIGDLKYKANTSLPPSDQMITAEPDVLCVEVHDNDNFIVLACDGVWDCMTSQECVNFVRERVGKKSLSAICEEVMDNCLSEDPRRTTGIGGDNMTCIVVLLNKNLTVREVATSEKVER